MPADDHDIPPPSDDDAPPSLRIVPPVEGSNHETGCYWGAAIVDEIERRSKDPTVALMLGGEELVRVRAGGIVVLNGGTGSGKTSLALGLLVEHARHVGPALAMSLELPANEAGGRAIGMQCDASWADVLECRLQRPTMVSAIPERLCIIPRNLATIAELRRQIGTARERFPGEPILIAVDYVQLLDSQEREVRRRVADGMAQLDRVTRDEACVTIALSQTSRANANALKSGEKMGAQTTDAGAEAAELERWASVTLAIGGHGPAREDGTCTVPISIGKARMGAGDLVRPATFCGRSGRYRLDGDARPAAEVREEHATARSEADLESDCLKVLGYLGKCTEPQTVDETMRGAHVGNAKRKRVMAALLKAGEVVHVRLKAPRASHWKLWTRERAVEKGIPIVEVDE